MSTVKKLEFPIYRKFGHDKFPVNSCEYHVIFYDKFPTIPGHGISDRFHYPESPCDRYNYGIMEIGNFLLPCLGKEMSH